LINPDRRDIAKAQFDGEPFRIDVGAKILDVVGTASTPGGAGFKAVTHDDTSLMIGPAVIGKHRTVSFTLLVDGDVPEPALPSSALHDFVIRRVTAGARWRYYSRRTRVLVAAASLATAGVLLGVIASQSGPSGAPSPRLTPYVAELGSDQLSTRLDGVAGLRRVMAAAPATQPDAIADLCAFIDKRSPAGGSDQPITGDVQAALNALTGRDSAHDGGAVVDLSKANLTNAGLANASLAGANLADADLTNANLSHADLRNAALTNAYLGAARIAGADLTRADLTGASFAQTPMCSGDKPVHPDEGYNCTL
jgi:hypothetical protein